MTRIKSASLTVDRRCAITKLDDTTNVEKEETQNQEKQNPLGTEKIGKLIKQFAIPCIISLLVSSLYNIFKMAPTSMVTMAYCGEPSALMMEFTAVVNTKNGRP